MSRIKTDTKIYDHSAICKEYIRRFGETKTGGTHKDLDLERRTLRYKEDLFNKQQEFIDDPSKLKTALCSRRAGKTYAVCYWLIQECEARPDSLCAYVGLTRSSAKRLMWSEIKRANRRYDLGMHFNNSELIASFPNGSQIFLTGANDEADVDKLRGSAYRLVVLDEAGSFGRHMDELVEEVLEPALIDHDGTLAMVGTPTAACSGMFHRATTDPSYGYSNHSWTILENPHVPHAKEWLDSRMKRKNWDKSHPIYQREWCGLWVRSNDSLVYQYTEEKNVFTDLPTEEHDFEYVLGLDLGYEDATAFVIGAFSRDLPDFYILDCHKQSKLIPSDIANMVKEYDAIYDFSWIVADTGGLGKSIVEELRQRYGLPFRAAEKRNKAAYIELMNGDLASGRVKVREGLQLLDEWRLLQWDEDRRIEDGRFENHLADAALYSWRESRHYTYQKREPEPVHGSDAYWKREEKKIWAAEESKLFNDEDMPWWEREMTMN